MPRYDYSAMTGPEITRRRDELARGTHNQGNNFFIQYCSPETIHEYRLLACRTMANACLTNGHPEQFIADDGTLASYARQFTLDFPPGISLSRPQASAWKLSESEIRLIFKNQRTAIGI